MDAKTKAQIAEDINRILSGDTIVDGHPIDPSLNTIATLIVARILLIVEDDLKSIADSLRLITDVIRRY